jgi:hypothetical protein
MSKEGFGAMLVFYGIGTIVLPLIGLQFRLMMLFGEASWIAGIAAIGAGVALLAGGGSS